MYLRKSKSRGKVYYQIVMNDGKIKQLGTVEKILKIFSIYELCKHTVSECNQSETLKVPSDIVKLFTELKT